MPKTPRLREQGRGLHGDIPSPVIISPGTWKDQFSAVTFLKQQTRDQAEMGEYGAIYHQELLYGVGAETVSFLSELQAG